MLPFWIESGDTKIVNTREYMVFNVHVKFKSVTSSKQIFIMTLYAVEGRRNVHLKLKQKKRNN